MQRFNGCTKIQAMAAQTFICSELDIKRQIYVAENSHCDR
jgi:hypothetical protein